MQLQGNLGTKADIQAWLEIPVLSVPSRDVSIHELPFLIGRGHQSGNHLVLDDLRISRRSATIYIADESLWIEDRGQMNGIFVNGEKVDKRALHNGDRIRLGLDNDCQLIFRNGTGSVSEHSISDARFRDLLGAIGSKPSDDLDGLRVLLEAATLLQSGLPLDSVLATILDHAIAVTRADRGMFLMPAESGQMTVGVGRDKAGNNLLAEAMNPSQTVVRQALEQRSIVINEDMMMADLNVQTAASVVIQMLRSAVVLPLYSGTGENSGNHDLLGAIYLDSKHTSTFSALNRQILEALGAQARSILENARLVQREQERQRLEQELNIARAIQQSLVPQGIQDFPHLAVTGLHRPCHEVGGDYFDVFPLEDGRVALLIADVSGKGLGAALVTTMLQGALTALTLGVDPVKVHTHLNTFLCDHASIGRYATMFFGLVDQHGMLEYVCAGHPSPLLLREGRVSDLYTEGSFPIGLISEATFESNRFQMEPGDTLVLFTDGVTEAEDSERDLFGDDRLREVLDGLGDDRPLNAIQTQVFDAVQRFSEGAKQSDDITLVLVRYQPAS
jgi:serine phosphatase RsbU (regulator of sigma subunit)